MAVELRSLRITSDFDAGRYVAGMNQKVSADNAGTQSSKAVGAAIDGLKIKVSSAIPLIERMSRTYIDGYGSAARFNTELMKLARSQDTSAASVEHLELIYGGLQKKFGLVADASELAVRGYGKLAAAIDNVNSRINAQGDATAITALTARVEQLRSQFDPTYVAAQRLTAELNDLAEAERLGVQISGGYERALENIMAKHDAVAASAKRQREEYARLAQEAREAQAADRAQADINQRLGVGSSNDNSAAQSAAAFTRQFEIARMRAEQEASNFASDLNSRFFSGAGTSARDSASVFSDQFAQQDELDRLRRQQQGAAFTSDLNNRLGLNGFGTSARSSASAFEEAAKSAEDLDRKVSLLRAQIDPLGAAQNRLNAELAEYDALAQRNAISTTELAQAQALARARYSNTADDMQRQEKRGVGGLPSYQLTNLMYQGTDVVQSLALGMPIQQVFLQQGPQIAQIFAANSAATKGFISSLGLTTVAIGGVTAAIALGAKSFNDYLVSVKAVDAAAAGVGRSTAGSASEMEVAAVAGAAAADISIKSARAMEVQFLRTGKIGSQYFEDLIGLSKDFAATIGIDPTESGGKLAEMFADPAKAAQQLYRQYGLLDASTADYVQRLIAQNRASEAQSVLLGALPQRLANAAEATTALGRAWDGVASSASNAWDWMGRAVDRAVSGPSAEERIQQLQRTLALPRVRGRENLEAELNDLMEQARRREQLAAAQAKEQADGRLAAPALDIASGSAATASARQRRELSDQVSSLTRGLTAGGLNDDQRKDLNVTLDATTRALNTLIPAQVKAQQLAEIDIRIANERNPLLRANLAAERERIQLAGEVISTAEAENRIALARNQIIQETIASSATQASDLRIEAEARQRLNAQVAAGSITAGDANRLLQEELALRPLIAAAAAAEGAEKERLNQIIADLRSGYAALAAEEKRATAQGIIQEQSNRLEMLRAEIDLVGKTTAEREKYIAALEAEQQIRREGLSGTDADRIRQQAAELATLRASLNRANFNDDLSFDERQFTRTSRDQQIASQLRGAGLAEDLNSSEANRMRGLARRQEIKEGITGFAADFRDALLANGGNIGKAFGESLSRAMLNASTKAWDSFFEQAASLITTALFGGKGSAAATSITGGVAASAASAVTGVANDKKVTRAPLADIANTDVASYIAKAASQRGIDPNVALNVAKSEGGLKSWNLQSTYMKNGVQEPSFGPYQLYMGGGLGNAFQKKTGLDPRLAANGPAGVDFALDHASKNGWGAWYGAGKAGISNWQGIGVGGSNTAVDAVGKLAESAKAATSGLNALGSGVGKLGQSLSTSFFPSAPAAPSGGGGGGLFSWLGGLFGGGKQWNLAKSGAITGLFSDGGYTGPGGVYEPRGVVHAGEVVWSQRDVARAGGVNVVEGMRRGLRGYSDGGTPDTFRPVVRWGQLPAANGNAASDRGARGSRRGEVLQVVIQGANGDEHVKKLVEQGVAGALQAQQIEADRGGFASTQQNYLRRKG